jgi:hypothetical protein
MKPHATRVLGFETDRGPTSPGRHAIERVCMRGGLSLALALGLTQLVAGEPESPESGTRTQVIVDSAVQSTFERFGGVGLKPEEVAVTLVDLTKPDVAPRGSYRGDVPIYPASVVKLFYLVATHRWLEDSRLQDTPELRRALSDMIVLSYNEATHYVVDLLTGTTSGPELPEDELKLWHDRRNAVNRYFGALGYTNINANKKPWCEGPYGRETQAIRTFSPKRNQLTTDATARLLVEIVRGTAVTPERSRQMLELMKRDPATNDPEDQAKFSGPALPAGSRLWSKAGWTSETRHDATYVELPSGGKFVLVVFTVNHANERGIIQNLVREIATRLDPAAGSRAP